MSTLVSYCLPIRTSGAEEKLRNTHLLKVISYKSTCLVLGQIVSRNQSQAAFLFALIQHNKNFCGTHLHLISNAILGISTGSLLSQLPPWLAQFHCIIYKQRLLYKWEYNHTYNQQFSASKIYNHWIRLLQDIKNH